MDALQTYNSMNHSEGFSSLLLPAFSLVAPNKIMNFDESPYIHELNRALQLEKVAVTLYTAKQRSSYYASNSGASAQFRTNQHFTAQRQLIRLIFAQSGMPKSSPATITAVTGSMAAKVSQFMPNSVQNPVLGVSAHRIERALTNRYQKLLKIAPKSDHELITTLLEQSNEFSLND